MVLYYRYYQDKIIFSFFQAELKVLVQQTEGFLGRDITNLKINSNSEKNRSEIRDEITKHYKLSSHFKGCV